ncbi:hypothetical protein PWY87_27845 [Kribbella solani]|nr:hypothetical protein [Kribbella solani]MDX3005523.1 hypothetical protein [Kribbella solani]
MIAYVEPRTDDRAGRSIGEPTDTVPYLAEIGDLALASHRHEMRTARQPAAVVAGGDPVDEILRTRVPGRLYLVAESPEVRRTPR